MESILRRLMLVAGLCLALAGGVAGVEAAGLNYQATLGAAWPVIPADEIKHVARKDNLVFAAAGTAGFFVVDVTDPSLPKVIGHADTPGDARWIALTGNVACVAVGTAGLQLIDIANPTLPVLLGRWPSFSQALQVQLANGFAFVVDGIAGLHIIDIHNTASPYRAGGYNTSGLALAVKVVGNLAYIADESQGLLIVDVSNPYSPTRVGGLDTLGTSTALEVVGNYAYVADGTNGLLTIDVTLPSAPVMTNRFKTNGIPVAVAQVKDIPNYLMVSYGTNGYSVVDATVVTNLIVQGSLDTDGTGISMDVGFPNTYLADGSGGIKIVNTKRFAGPVLTAQLPMPSPFRAIALTAIGNNVYVHGNDNTVYVVDASIATNPIIRGQITGIGTDLPFIRQPIMAAGNRIYSYAGSNMFQIIDASNPVNPIRIGLLDVGSLITGLCLQPGRALLACRSGSSSPGSFQIVDVSDPATMSIVYSNQFTTSTPTAIAANSSFAYLPTINGTAIYALDGPGNPRPVPPGWPSSINNLLLRGDVLLAVGNPFLQVISLSDPTAPSLIGQVSPPGSTVALCLAAQNNLVFIPIGDGLYICDVSIPAQTRFISKYAGLLAGVASIDLSGNLAFLASQGRGLLVFDISDQGAQLVVGTLPAGKFARRLQLQGTRLVAAEGMAGVEVLDVSGRTPAVIGRYDTPGEVYNLAAVSNRVFLADGTNGLVVLSLPPAGNPALLGQLDTPGLAQDVAVNGSAAFVADGTNGVVVVDVSDPTVPMQVGRYGNSKSASGLFLRTNSLFLADGTNGIQILNVSTAASPVRLSGLAGLGTASSLTVKGDLAYMATGTNGLRIIDVSNLTAPVLVGTYPTTGSAVHVDVSGLLAFVATGTNGVEVVDVGDPTSPMGVTVIPTAGTASGVLIDNKTAYVAIGDKGLRILSLVPPGLNAVVTNWITQTFPMVLDTDRGPFADPDGDGAVNALEYFFGSHPGSAEPSAGRLPVPTKIVTGGVESLELIFPVNSTLVPGLGWGLEMTDTLTSNSWSTVPFEWARRAGSNYHIRLPSGVSTNEFFRLRLDGN